ncbi:MAG: hypothetical protein QXU79_00235 [Candidatus Micrarchaeaceae archaeon]
MVEIENLFGTEDAKLELSEGEFSALKSYFYKTCRIGAWKQAIIAGEYIKRAKGAKEVLRLLLTLLTEDGDPDEVARIAPTLYAAMQPGAYHPPHLLWHLIYLVATCKKWYETKRGQELEQARHIVKEKDLPKIEFPSWVFDRHTSEGWRRIREGRADLRLDGGWDNRWPLQKLYLQVTKGAESHEEAREKWVSYWFKEEGA